MHRVSHVVVMLVHSVSVWLKEGQGAVQCGGQNFCSFCLHASTQTPLLKAGACSGGPTRRHAA